MTCGKSLIHAKAMPASLGLVNQVIWMASSRKRSFIIVAFTWKGETMIGVQVFNTINRVHQLSCSMVQYTRNLNIPTLNTQGRIPTYFHWNKCYMYSHTPEMNKQQTIDLILTPTTLHHQSIQVLTSFQKQIGHLMVCRLPAKAWRSSSCSHSRSVSAYAKLPLLQEA